MTADEIRAAIATADADGSAAGEFKRMLGAIAIDLAAHEATPATAPATPRDALAAAWRKRMERAAAHYFDGAYFAAASQLEMLAEDLRDFAAPSRSRPKTARRRRR